MDILNNMSDLQLSLIIIGIIVIAGVAVFNWLQQHRYRRKVQAAFDHEHNDILLDTHNPEDIVQRIEPKLNKTPISDIQLEIVKLSQINERTIHRNNQINSELTEIKQTLDSEISLQESAKTELIKNLEQAF